MTLQFFVVGWYIYKLEGWYTYVQVVLHMGLLKTNEFSPCLALGSNELKIEHGL